MWWDLVRSVVRFVPIPVRINGRARDVLVRSSERLAGRGRAKLAVAGRVLDVDLSEPQERLAYLAWPRLLATYRATPLGHIITTTDWRKKPVFVDVGANLGVYSAVARDAGAEPLMAEPEPALHAFLGRNPDVFGKVSGVALSDEDGVVQLFQAKADKPGVSSLEGKTADAIYGGSIEVPRRTFLTWLGEVGIAPERIGLVKIDVEGHEVGAVRGMLSFLETTGQRPRIFCEVRGAKSDRAPDSWREVRDLLARFGYHAYEPEGPVFDPASAADRKVFDLDFRT